MTTKLSFWIITFACLLCNPGMGQEATEFAAVEPLEFDFTRDIKPLLTSRCFLCHGPDESSREAGLRLDTFEGATEDLGDYAAIAPGNLEDSEMVLRILSDDESEVMPPAEQGNPLSQREKQLLQAWIKAGAKYQMHWSYVSPQRLPVAKIRDPELANWPRNPIDEYVLEKMLEKNLTPERPADRLTLARRLSIDLTGLPPTVEIADAFANDDDPNAYENLVDQLLASNAYGEHWAASWLDLARYADSAGYAEDKTRTIWAYRDYVIKSFRTNQPYDEFTIEQIAGDMLPKPTRKSLIATAFHRNTLTNSEGGTDDEEFRTAAVVDRTNTTMAVWMGTTMACAQCHTHKYDPITQEEYFQFYAILNNTADNDNPSEQPTLKLYSESQLEKRELIQAEIDGVKMQLSAWNAVPVEDREKTLARQQAKWESSLQHRADGAVVGQFVRVSLSGNAKILQLAEVQVMVGGANVALKGKSTQSSTYPDGEAKHANDGNTSGVFSEHSVSHSQSQKSPWWKLDLGGEKSIEKVVIWNRTDASTSERLNGFRVEVLASDESVVWTKTFKKAKPADHEIECTTYPQGVQTALVVPEIQRNGEQRKIVSEYYLAEFGPAKKLVERISSLETELDSVTPGSSVPVLKELAQARTTRIQIRGSHLILGDEVTPNTPAVFPPLSEGPKDRLALARWLVDTNNPLTARVAVNRYWQRLFGTGLVRTSEDFGAQGELPTHPKLLDYLAVEFMEQGWDNRALLKRMVMSSTYQQSSRASSEKRELDSSNRWLSRGARFRVTAETVRDQALFSAGLLSQKMYGPPVMPPAPALGLKAAFSGQIAWNTSLGEDRYRRAIYTQWRRSSPYPSMETFDVSNREVCDLRRISTNTPLQALVTLNDEVYVEAAQALARRMMAEEIDVREIATAGFRHVLIRKPTEAEIDELVHLYKQTKSHFSESPEDAATFAIDALNPVADGTDIVALASWTTVANVLLNLDEVFLKR